LLLHVNDGILVGGVDEAGRGSIIGPLVVAGISVRESNIGKLKRIGVRDSKMLSPKTRASLFGDVISAADSICIHKINSTIIDDNVFLKGLNRLEARAMAHVINNINADEVYVDCCDINPERYRLCIEHYLTCRPKLHSMHHADTLNVVVAAASIIAKITRDQEISEIRKIHYNIGSGYPSDKITMRFIKRWVAKKGFAPDFARRSWKPLQLIMHDSTTVPNY